MLFSIVVELIYISTNTVLWFFFPYILARVHCCLWNDCVEISMSFDFYFLNGQWCWTFFQVYIGHLYFWELPVHFIWSLINLNVDFEVFIFWEFLYVLVINPLSDIYLSKISSHSLDSFLSLVTVSFTVRSF
jgi:hypothetical protein